MELKDKWIFTVGEVSEILSLRRENVVDLITNGYLKAIRLRGYHITKKSLMEFLNNYDGVDIGNEMYGRV